MQVVSGKWQAFHSPQYLPQYHRVFLADVATHGDEQLAKDPTGHKLLAGTAESSLI
jgi:hypothetical protein